MGSESSSSPNLPTRVEPEFIQIGNTIINPCAILKIEIVDDSTIKIFLFNSDESDAISLSGKEKNDFLCRIKRVELPYSKSRKPLETLETF